MFRLALLVLWLSGDSAVDLHGRPLLLVLSFDGLGHDRLEHDRLKASLPNLSELRKRSCYVPRLRPPFPSVSVVSHLSLVTGLWPESHGVVADPVWDPESGKAVDPSLHPQAFRVVPIWASNEQAGGTSGVSGWPLWGQRPPTHVGPGDGATGWRQRLDEALSWFEMGANLVVFRESMLMDIGRLHGPDSEQVMRGVEELDRLVGHLLDRLLRLEWAERLNVICVSGHGLAANEPDLVIPLQATGNGRRFRVSNRSPALFVHTEPGREEDLYREFLEGSKKWGFRVLRRNEFPRRWHLKRSPRAGDLILLASPPNAFSLAIWKGSAGYDNKLEKMQGFLLAWGPALKKGFNLDMTVDVVDVYPLLCHLLDIPPRPNNGSFIYHLSSLIPIEEVETFSIYSILLTIGVLGGTTGLIIASVIIIMVCKKCQHRSKLKSDFIMQ
ncbi:unnamed protein product [Darwinula stevensoni]|uniref:AP3A hydrolase n=1 Tax=Darwinula stevensoni TaxID=69355 RepID=A0A7R8X8W3_9CRUS|nr:unnamed protein product [Darwinula stevensoni]CAG0890549.1 unnamed protein product [Darwinula stevensoni]